MRRLMFALLLVPFPALADPPRVVTDIPPVHALVASVMQGVGTPELLLPPGASPHDYALRPSQARALSGADIVFWIGPALTPWLDRAVTTLGQRARVVSLLQAPGTVIRHYGGAGHDDDHGHGTAIDPHAWLDPANPRIWLPLIASVLARADPGNAAVYRANAERAVADLAKTRKVVEDLIGPVRGGAFVLYHDGFRYFQAAFSIQPLAVIADGDAVRPGAARLTTVRDLLAAHPGACVFLEPQIPARAVEAVVGGSGVRVAVLDPLGADAEPGPGLYHAVLTGIARAMHDCLAGRSDP